MLNADVMNGKSKKSVVGAVSREMVFHRGRRAAGFTLMELLVVVAIIALLMGLSFPAIRGAIHRARMTRARSEIQSLQQAWLAYWNTYYDPVTGLPDFVEWSSAGTEMNPAAVAVLAGVDTDANPRGIVFMEFDDVHLVEGFRSPLRGPAGNYLPYIIELGSVTQESEWRYETRVFVGNAARGKY